MKKTKKRTKIQLIRIFYKLQQIRFKLQDCVQLPCFEDFTKIYASTPKETINEAIKNLWNFMQNYKLL